jgi:hypothetical protein
LGEEYWAALICIHKVKIWKSKKNK